MTAIFAHVTRERALLAADTLRIDPLGLFGDRTVGKLFCWANCIPFGGAGNGPRLAKLATTMIENQGEFTPDEAGFLAAFTKYQSLVYADATSGKGVVTSVASLTTGTLLASVPAMGGYGEHILKLDFATGSATTLPDRVAAEGTDANALTTIAATAFHKTHGSTGLPGDRWAGEAISQSVTSFPNAIGFPFDIIVTERDASGTWVAHSARFANVPAAANPHFHMG